MTKRVFNFSPGPAMLPLEVLEEAQRDLLNWEGRGMSVMEISHRSPEFVALAQEIEQDFREVLGIPDHYRVLFLSGGAQVQFAMIPLNLSGDKKSFNYACTGHWSMLAASEASRYGKVQVVTNSEPEAFKRIAPESSWEIDPEGAYLHYVDNETIHGVEFPFTPKTPGGMPLVVDMSSNLLSRPLDVSQYGLIYACAQKNLAPAGITVVIVREDLLGRASPLTPTVYDYKLQAESNSMRNTPPTFPWYMIGLNLKWIKKQGGIFEIAKRNDAKSKKLYEFIDQSKFYINPVHPDYRSRMSVIFNLKDESLNQLFLEKALNSGLAYLKGHQKLGGMRASLYNAMPEEGVDALIAFMKEFEKVHA